MDNFEAVEVRGFAPRRSSVANRDPALRHPHRRLKIAEYEVGVKVSWRIKLKR